jgi:hypothetical protein
MKPKYGKQVKLANGYTYRHTIGFCDNTELKQGISELVLHLGDIGFLRA